MKWVTNIFKVLLANGLNLLSGFGITILLSLSLTVVTYGDYAIILSVLALLLIVPNACNPASILFLSNAHGESKSTLWTLLMVRILLSGLIALIVALSSAPIAEYLHDGRIPAYLYSILGLQALFMSLERQLLQWYQVQERFGDYSRLTFSARLLKIGAMVILFTLGEVTLPAVIMLLLVTQIIALLPAFIEVWKESLFKQVIDRLMLPKMWNYTLWILLSQILVYIGTRANIVIISRYTSPTETGHFGFALTLLESLFLLSQSVIAVVTPRLLNLDRALNRKKTVLLFGGLALLYFVICFSAPRIAAILVEGAMKSKYLESVYIFKKLALGAWFFMVSTGPMVLLHRKKKTVSIAAIEGVGAATLIGGNFLLLPSLGIEGAVNAFIISRFSTMIVLFVVLFKETSHYRKLKLVIVGYLGIHKNRKNEQYIESSQHA